MKRRLYTFAALGFAIFGFIIAFMIIKRAELNSTQVSMEEKGFRTPHTVDQNPTITPLSAQQSLKQFRIPEGYELEVVASEPMISEPTAIAWDGNGRMYVAQLETYMQTIDAKGQDEPRSRIILLEDLDDDGKMDKSSVFISNLLSPRMLLCAGNELLVNETNTYDIWAYKDTDGDGIADKKRIAYENKARAYGNIEHQRSGLDWNIDNYIYVTADPVRFGYKNGMLKPDTLISGSNGQWGLTHDNYGRLFFSRAASGMPATGFQINPFYGQLDFEDATDTNFLETWPIIKTPDVNGGPKTLRKDSTMKVFTAAAGQSVYRGDRLPITMQGDYIVAEPVGRFIRRAKITDHDGLIYLKNAYERDEFITSKDMNFRPVNTYTGPDGCLYIVDMYRGVIQESTWAQPGSFLYDQIISKGLDKNVRRGRIYRLVYKDIKRGPKPDMLDASTDKLITYLSHPNGWWRDNAQKELIVRNDERAIPALKKIVLEKKSLSAEGPSAISRLHAIWTLEALGSIDQKILLAVLKDPDPQIRKAAIRISEQYLKKNDPKILTALKAIINDNSTDVLAQLIQSLTMASSPIIYEPVVAEIMRQNTGNKLLIGVNQSLKKNDEAKKYGYKLMGLAEPVKKSIIKGAAIFNSLCSVCHGPEGQGLATNVAPPLIGKFKLIQQKEGLIKILLHGLTGQVDGKMYDSDMPAMGANDDKWIADVLSYVRYDLAMKSFPKMNAGYNNWLITTPEDVKDVRDKFVGRTTPWTWEEIKTKSK